jgi:hypothetical protein
MAADRNLYYVPVLWLLAEDSLTQTCVILYGSKNKHTHNIRKSHFTYLQTRQWGETIKLCTVNLTLSPLMSYISMELLIKPEILTLYIYGPTSGNAESRLFLFSAQCFNTESMQKVILWHSCV